MKSLQVPIQCYGVLIQLALLKLSQIEAEGKEYEAPWLKNSGKVMRDASGRFYSNAKKSAGDAVTGVQEVTDDLVQGLLGDEGFLKRAGLQAGQFGGEVVKAIQNAPTETVKALEEASASVQESVLNEYEAVNELFAKSIKEAKIPSPPADAPLHEKFRYQAAVLNALQENIRETDNFKGAMKALGQIAKAALPVLSTMALIAIPEVAIAGATAASQGVAVGELLTNIIPYLGLKDIATRVAALTMTSVATDMTLDRLGTENGWVRFAAQIATGILTERFLLQSIGSLVEKGIKRKSIIEKATDHFRRTRTQFLSLIRARTEALWNDARVPLSWKVRVINREPLYLADIPRIDPRIKLPQPNSFLSLLIKDEDLGVEVLDVATSAFRNIPLQKPILKFMGDLVQEAQDEIHKVSVRRLLEKAKPNKPFNPDKETLFDLTSRVGDIADWRRLPWVQKYAGEAIPNPYDSIRRLPGQANRLPPPAPIASKTKTIAVKSLRSPGEKAHTSRLTQEEYDALKKYTSPIGEGMNAYLRIGPYPHFLEIMSHESRRHIPAEKIPTLIDDATSGLARLPRYEGSTPLVRIIEDPSGFYLHQFTRNQWTDKARALLKKAGKVPDSDLFLNADDISRSNKEDFAAQIYKDLLGKSSTFEKGFKEKGFLSFTLNPNGALRFGDDLLLSKRYVKTIKMIVHPSEISQARHLGDIKPKPFDSEVVYPPGQRFRLLKLYDSPSGLHTSKVVELEELD